MFVSIVFSLYNYYSVFYFLIPECAAYATVTAVGEGRALSGLWREGGGGLHCSGLLPGAGGSRLAC